MSDHTTLFQYIQTTLSPLYAETEIQGICRIMAQECLNIPFVSFYSDKYSDLALLQKDIIQQTVDRLLNNEPIQYIIGHSCFYGLTLKVNSATLIPRPETEELVELIIQNNNREQTLSVVDIGTGSGCIATALAVNLPKAVIHGWDISEAALQVAQSNAANHHATIDFRQVDILNNEPEGLFDIIVSNPPYVTPSQKQEMSRHVLDYEPHLALFVTDEEPLLYYKAIAKYAQSHLNSGGKLYFEINAILGRQTRNMIIDMGFQKANLYQDIAGRDRMIEALI